MKDFSTDTSTLPQCSYSNPRVSVTNEYPKQEKHCSTALHVANINYHQAQNGQCNTLRTSVSK